MNNGRVHPKLTIFLQYASAQKIRIWNYQLIHLAGLSV
ncbi:nitric oxide synthase oxygenase [Cytobacillus oceanisediminis]